MSAKYCVGWGRGKERGGVFTRAAAAAAASKHALLSSSNSRDALLNQSFRRPCLFDPPSADPTAYRSRYLCPLATRRWCDLSVLLSWPRYSACLHAATACAVSVAAGFSLPLGRDNRRLGPSGPPTLSTTSRLLHTCAAEASPGLGRMGRKKVGGWARMQGPLRFPRPQGAGRRGRRVVFG